jgi:hypothetical protein
MRNFLCMSTGAVVAPLQLELMRKPLLWGKRSFRTTFPGTPHQDIEDIWLRFNGEVEKLDASNPDLNMIWYPEVKDFPSLQELVLPLMLYTKSYSLERLLLTRLPPGGRISPHADDKGPYVGQQDINRYHIVVQGLPGSLFRCGEETVQMLTGEIWWFNPMIEHECLNNSAADRIHLLVDLKGWPTASTPL